MGNPHNIKPGQEVLYVDNNNHTSRRTVTVVSVGRRWATTDMSIRFDLEDLIVDGGQYTSLGKIWVSEKVYIDFVMKNEAWRSLVNRIPMYQIPDHMTIGDVLQIERLVFADTEGD